MASVAAAGTSTGPGLGGFERRMLRRRLARYYRWVGRTFGWSTIFYLIFWIALFVMGGVQSAAPLGTPVPVTALPVALDALALAALASVALQRTPPVVMGRAHAQLLGLAPWPAARVLRPRLVGYFVSRVLVGGVVGTAAWLLVSILFALSAPALVAAGAALWLLRSALATLVYERNGAAWPLLGFVSLLAVVGVASAPLGYQQGALAPALAAASAGTFALVGVIVALTGQGDAYPAGYLYDATVVSEFRSAVLFAVMTQNAGALRRRGPLAGSRRRRGRRAGRARLRLPPPPAQYGALGGMAWRSALNLLRAPLLMKLALLGALGYVYATLSAGVVGGLPLAVLGIAAGFLASWLLGPAVEPMPLPVDAFARGGGRVLPGVLAAGVLFAALAVVGVNRGGSVSGSEAALLAFALLALATVTLEKASSWLHVSHREWTTWGLSGLLSGTLLWILSALGGPGAIALGALGLAFFALLMLP